MNRPTTQTCIDGTVYTFVEDTPVLLSVKSGPIRELYFNGAARCVLWSSSRIEVVYDTKRQKLYLVPENFESPLAESTGFEPMAGRPHMLRAVTSREHISKMLVHLATHNQALSDLLLLPVDGERSGRIGWACAIVAKGPDRPLCSYPITVDLKKGVKFSHRGPLHPSRLAMILALGGGDVRFNERTKTIAPCYYVPLSVTAPPGEEQIEEAVRWFAEEDWKFGGNEARRDENTRVEDGMIDYANTHIDTPTGAWIIGAHAVDRYIERIRESCPTRERANIELAVLLQLMPQPLPDNDGSGGVSSSWMLTDPESGYERSITFCFRGDKLSTCYWTDRKDETETAMPDAKLLPPPKSKARSADTGTPLLSVYPAPHAPSYLNADAIKALRHAKSIDIVPNGDGAFILTPGAQVALRYRSDGKSGGANISVETVYGAYGRERPPCTAKYRLERAKGIDGLVFRPDTPLRSTAVAISQDTHEKEGIMTSSTPNGAHQAIAAEYSIVPIEGQGVVSLSAIDLPISALLELAFAKLDDPQSLFALEDEHRAILAAYTKLDKKMPKYMVARDTVLNYREPEAAPPPHEAGTDDVPTETTEGA